MAKVSISIDDADITWLKRRAVRVHGGNLSAAVAEGTKLLRHNEALGALLDDLGAPELTSAQLETFGAELDGSAQRRPAQTKRAKRRRDA